MRAEDKYKAQLEELGIYQPAFDPAIHTLCMMERELRREQKEWSFAKKRAADAQDGGASDKMVLAYIRDAESHYATIMSLRRDILAHRDALGLTPKGLQRLRGKEAPVGDTNGAATVHKAFQALYDKVQSYE